MTNPAQVSTEALVDFMFESECDPQYEDDEFCVTFEGHRLFVTRKPDCYIIEFVGFAEFVELPRP